MKMVYYSSRWCNKEFFWVKFIIFAFIVDKMIRMKREYSYPSVELMDVQTVSLLCISGGTDPGGTGEDFEWGNTGTNPGGSGDDFSWGN